MIPQYNTKTFCDIWDSVADFKADLLDSPFADCIHKGETVGQMTYPDSQKLAYYLLYAKYGNNPIANMDENQFKFKLFSLIYAYGPTWEKKTEIQKNLRKLTDDEIMAGGQQMFNHAMNPNTEPGVTTTEEITYINDQNVTKAKKGKVEGYATLWSMLSDNIDEAFVNRFIDCFKKFVQPENPLLYITDLEE